MDKSVSDGKAETNSRSPQKVEDEEGHNPIGGEDESEVNSLLPPRTGGMSRKLEKTGRKVRWNDNDGNKLFEVLEFQPSDISDSEDEDEGEDEDEDEDSCVCTIM
ncbi:uncharacterized protein LOC116198890 [Punica granatum]|uniref:Uncharacterized protein n=2 Tax=Punica granatum TaxID=22663 RepID=A0A2I0HTT2_PUNGR|nr:uncharacterized protein LOC116198890 [Punica granatum]PKI35109.1 hypothetical protein CRG98_044498 [Punica granatum]